MAQKKSSSRAERVVSETKRKTPASAAGSSRKQKKPAAAPKKAPAAYTEYDNPIPSTAITAVLSVLLLVLFVVILINPEGALLRVVQSVVLGLIGRAGFYFSIPALLSIFVINTFGKKTSARMRTICLSVFVLLCGAVYHLAVQRSDLFWSLDLIPLLYLGGANGTTGGILCGAIAMALSWACGKTLSYVILIIVALLVLLAAMLFTPPSIARAIANRPRDDWKDDEDDYIEPAAIVVNKIATHQIEQKRKRREQARQAPAPAVNSPAQRAAVPAAKPVQVECESEMPVKKPARETPAQQEPVQDTVKQVPGKGSAFMNRIDVDISAPLGGTAAFVREDTPSVFDEPVEQIRPRKEPTIPSRMPELKRDEPIAPAPILEEKPKAPVREESQTKAPVQEAPSRKVTAKDAAQSAQEVASEIQKSQAASTGVYRYPPIELLKRPTRGSTDGTDEMRENSRRLNETLASFRIDAHIINVTRGPSVTRYEVELDKGVRLNKLTGCADDIALSLGASGVRIAAVPGKISVVGIEVPNRTVTTVSLREVIDSPEFGKAKSKSSFAVGKDIGGSCIIGNIAKMPHLLIAGTTGSGKSVCMNSIIISLLYKASPEDVKLIMVDPKMVELGIYNGIPHLLIPVVTDPKKAAGSLQWAVTEMLRRYKLMSDAGVRDLESYNSIVEAEEDGQRMPQIVVIIDELADMMMVAAKEVEDSICRIAQMGRAAGMHLIIATQRPSADVITGLMKANIPSRIAFSVASAMESRIILDTMGAEKLVGKGDMLFAPIGSGKPLRVQGCFVTDAEVEAVASFVKENSDAEYNQQVLEEIEKKAAQAGKKTAGAPDPEPTDEELEGDEMLPAAVDVIMETGQASVSMLQRRLKLGYARAARIVDEMEEKGIVGPFQGSKPRAILITKEEWALRKSGGQQMSFEDVQDME